MSLSSAAVSLICFSVESWTAVSAPVSLHGRSGYVTREDTEERTEAEDQCR